MKNNFIKTAIRIFNKSKSTIIKNAPQILAVAGVGCFVTATVCAAKETPKAMEKLEAKKHIDPNLSIGEKVAIVAPEYKKTIVFTGLGMCCALSAWKVEKARFAELAGLATTAISDKGKLKEALVEQVGEDKAKEICDKIEEDNGIYKVVEGDDASALPPDDYRWQLFRLECTGKEFWHRKAKVEEALSDCRGMLRRSGVLSLGDIYEELGLTAIDLELGFVVNDLHTETDVCDEFSWELVPFEDDYGRLGWNIKFTRAPKELPF